MRPCACQLCDTENTVVVYVAAAVFVHKFTGCLDKIKSEGYWHLSSNGLIYWLPSQAVGNLFICERCDPPAMLTGSALESTTPQCGHCLVSTEVLNMLPHQASAHAWVQDCCA